MKEGASGTRLKPAQQFANTTGKNSTDSTMIIDAMDLLYTRRFDGFCIVSCDSDFTGLVLRILEEGLMVYGFGEEKTPDAFRKACHKFNYTEVLRPVTPQEVKESEKPKSKEAPQLPLSPFQRRLSNQRHFPRSSVLQALEQTLDDSGWAQICTFGSYL